VDEESSFDRRNKAGSASLLIGGGRPGLKPTSCVSASISAGMKKLMRYVGLPDLGVSMHLTKGAFGDHLAPETRSSNVIGSGPASREKNVPGNFSATAPAIRVGSQACAR
jgi:hypothetical protein